jgi:molybdate transport system permease protein
MSWRPPGRQTGFWLILGTIAGCYLVWILALVLADVWFMASRGGDIWRHLASPEIRYATQLSLISSSLTAILSVWVAVPVAYLMSRSKWRGKVIVDAILDVPIFLPPMVVGLSLLLLFRQTALRPLDEWLGIAFQIPAVILAQFVVASALAIRTLRATFDGISPREETVALSLGASRFQAFARVVIPQAWPGMVTAGTLAWARAFGEFGPVLVFAGTTRGKTEVLSVSVYLELSRGQVEAAVSVAILMMITAAICLIVVRLVSARRSTW